jgi:Delta7-sterol 5-desaturase
MDFLPTVADTLLGLSEPWPTIFAFDFGRYLVAAAGVAGVIAALPIRLLDQRGVQERTPRPRQRTAELWHSAVAALVFSLVGTAVYWGAVSGSLKIYTCFAEYGPAYWLGSLVVIVVAHDAYFYWMHRWMHRPEIFRRVHQVHHQSVAPTAWAAYSFSLREALVQALFLPLFLLLAPMHPSALFVWMAHQVIRNAVGHCGVEIVPRSWLAGWWGRWLTTTLHHDLHHSTGRHNYGLYFAWWDRWCGTEHPEYRQRLVQLLDRMERKIESGMHVCTATSPSNRRFGPTHRAKGQTPRSTE